MSCDFSQVFSCGFRNCQPCQSDCDFSLAFGRGFRSCQPGIQPVQPPDTDPCQFGNDFNKDYRTCRKSTRIRGLHTQPSQPAKPLDLCGRNNTSTPFTLYNNRACGLVSNVTAASLTPPTPTPTPTTPSKVVPTASARKVIQTATPKKQTTQRCGRSSATLYNSMSCGVVPAVTAAIIT
jgi:hypothetical protein